MLRISALRGRLLSATAIASVFSIATAAANAGALPTGGHYISGHGSINKASASLTVKQSSTTGIIDWSSFSIGGKNGVKFDNGSGATLNRVTGGNLSTIAGSLRATGSLYLMNSRGVIVSGTGRVVTGGSFVVSSGALSGGAFENDRFKLRNASGKVVNRGTIVAGGDVALAGRNVSDSGSISAARITLKAVDRLRIGGDITARNADGTGGTVVATARHIAVGATANISASGITGGTVLVGGDVHGGATAADNFIAQSVHDARTTKIAKGAQISADASKGAGGDIVIWSDGRTTFAGAVSAKGQTGGGFAEVSSHHLLGFTGTANLLSTHGATGTLLLDPENVVIENETTTNGSVSGGTFTPNGDDSILSVADLEQALASASVKVTTGSGGAQTGDIAVLAPITWSSGHTLTLDAYHSVLIDADIAITGAGGLAIMTDDGGTGGSYSLGDGAFVDYGPTNNGGKLTINGTAYTLIYTMAKLQAINSGLTGNYALATSLDASATTNWKPLGTNGTGTVSNSGNGFVGTFEGLGNMIFGLNINLASKKYVGLFGYSGGTIRDVGLIGGNISGAASVGALVGYNSGGAIINAYSTDNVAGAGSNVGGLVGYNGTGSITQAFSTGTVTDSKGSDVGGLIGENNGSIGDSYASGAVSGIANVGGFVGSNLGAITMSYATGGVHGTSDIGGFVGSNSSTGTVDESYEAGVASGSSNVGGFVGDNEGFLGSTTYIVFNNTLNANIYGVNNGSFAVVELTTAQMMAAAYYTWTDFGTTPGGAAGQAWVIVDADGSLNNAGGADGGTFPMLLSEYSTNITTPHQLQLMELALSGDYSLATSMSLANTNAGDVWGTTGFIPIGGNTAGADFTGTFSGNGNTISGLYIDNTVNTYVGLFGESTGSVENLNLTGATVASDVTSSEVGVLAGYSDGNITSSNSSGAITVDATTVYAGGLVGSNDGNINNSSSSASVSNTADDGILGGLAGYNDNIISNSHATGQISGSDAPYAGGLVGENYYGTILGSHATGKVAITVGSGGYDGGLIGFDEAGQIDASYATGAVTADASTIGGLIGEAYYDNIVNSYASGAVSGKDSAGAGGLAGYLYVGNISGSHATGKVTVSYGTGATNYAGGLVGYDYGDGYNEIANSYASGAVSAAGPTAAAGGLVGYAYDGSDITTSHASGAVGVNGETGTAYAGGLVGYVYDLDNIADSYATGNVTGDNLSYAGGLIGYNYYYNSLNNSYATGNVKGYVTGGLIGYSFYDNFLANSHASGNVTGLLDSGYSYTGGLIGFDYDDVSLLSLYATGAVNGGSTTDDDTYAGGLIGYAYGSYPLASSYATGSVKGAYFIGGLIGYSDIPIVSSYATGSVTVATNGDGGGLVGYNDDSIVDSYATGNVTAALGTDAYVGGLVGANYDTINQSFATGNVVADGSGVYAGGLVGYTDENLSQVYALGSVTGDGTGTSSAYFGGLVGYNDANITQAYSVGDVSGTGGGFAGGLVGANEYATNIVTHSYWDTQTSGQSVSAGGIGRTTAQLQAGLPSGFSSGDWKIVAGTSFPYLAWQVASGTPEVVSGTISGETTDAGLTVHVLVNGKAATPLAGMSSGANGYYYELLAPGTISSSGSDVLAYLASGSNDANTFEQSALGSLTGFNLAAKTLKVTGSATSETALLAALEKALGLNSGSKYLYTKTGSFTSGITLDLILSASAFTIDHAINLGAAGTLNFNAAGSITQSSADAIKAGTLKGQAHGAVALNASNAISELASFSTGGNSFELTDDHDLTTAGLIKTGGGELDITTGSGDSLAVDSTLKTTGTINLVSGDAITEGATGAVDAHLLNVTAKTGIALTSTHNHIKKLGTDQTTTGPNHVTL